MPESDVTKMKVADLKRELKLRGLPLNGNKNELQDRLQTALLEGDISLEDSAIADAIDDDVSLTDEDEHKLLSENEELLLKSPIRTLGSTPPDVETPASLSDLTPSTIIPPLTAKKIVLKRNNSLSLSTTQLTTTTTTSKENAAPDAAAIKDALDSEANTLKSKHKPIVVGSAAVESKDAAEKKLGELSIKERLELRAKKFGIAVEEKAAAPTAKTVGSSPAVNKSSSASIKANKGNKETDEQQKEALKRRAERFGCVVPEKTSKAEVEERLQKRKARFGASAETATDAKSPDAWAEKARARLERFKAAPAASAAETAAK